LFVQDPGRYWIDFSAILLQTSPSYTALIPVFLRINGFLDPNNPVLGGVVALQPGIIATAREACAVQLPGCATLASNGGSPEPQPVTVLGWKICLFKIPPDSHCKQ
jgi:hypothetical protein